MPTPDDIPRATGLRDALQAQLGEKHWLVRALTTAIESNDAQHLAETIATVERNLPSRARAELAVAQALRLAAHDTAARFAFVVDVEPTTVAMIGDNVMPRWEPRFVYLLDPTLPAGPSTRITFLGGPRGVHVPSLERVLRSLHGTLAQHVPSEEHARQALLARAGQPKEGAR